MPFKRMLQSLVDSVPGATGAILADWEGESVEYFCQGDDFELKVIAAHKGVILNLIREVHDTMAAGVPREAVITTHQHHVVIGPVGNDYALVMTLHRDAILGRALVQFRDAAASLYGEIY